MLLFLLSYTVEVLHAKTTILFIEWASTFLLDKQITFVIIKSKLLPCHFHVAS